MRKEFSSPVLLVLIGFIFILPLFTTGPNQLQGSTRAVSWTIMVYLDGDCNLEDAAIDDFLEMATVGSTAEVKIVVQFDRINGYDTRYGDWTSTKRYLVTAGMTPSAENALEDIGEANVGDPATVVDFVNWAKTNYPATNYALVFWNHGGGWRKSKEELFKDRYTTKKKELMVKAVCWDDTNGGDCLYMSEVKSALSSCGGANLIGFDACLMGMVEVAYEIKDHGQVMVGSEETEPWDGWPWDTISSDITSNPIWTPEQLGSAIVDRYYESYGNDQTQSAINLSNLSTLASTTSVFAQNMMDNWDSNEAAVRSAAQDVMAEIDNTVINEKHGGTWPGANGLAIYFPDSAGSFNSDYNSTIIDFPKETQWEEFLAEFYSSMGGSWIEARRLASQEFYYPEHIDLYHFCEMLSTVPKDYYSESQISHEYNGGGTDQGLEEDDGYLTYSLPFDFPYFGETLPIGTTIYISSNGYVDFDASSNHTDFSNSVSELAGAKRIAPCWADLRTNGAAQPGEDIYITENISNLIIRWVAEEYEFEGPVNVELVLYNDGRIQFNYNGGNSNIAPWGTPPTIGISKGDSVNHYLSVYNTQATLTNVDSDLFTPVPKTLTVISPYGTEDWILNSDHEITWDSSGALNDLKISLWKEGKKVGLIAYNIDSTAGSYTWKVGQLVGATADTGAGYTVKIIEMGYSTGDTSDDSFSISSKYGVTSPNGGENWVIGSTENITWEVPPTFSGLLKITLWKDGIKVGAIANNISGQAGSYPWTVGQHSGGTAIAGTGYKVRIKVKGKSQLDMSDDPFTVSN